MNEAKTTPVSQKQLVRLLRHLGTETLACVPVGDGFHVRLVREGEAGRLHRQAALAQAAALGLVQLAGRQMSATAEAASFLLRTRLAAADDAFLGQHRDMAPDVVEMEGLRQGVRRNLKESPLSALTRLKDRKGEAFLSPEALDAGERLRADFTRGRLQPRLTSSWEPRLASRGKGQAGGGVELSDSALAARLRFNRAVEAMGPELSGVAVDICCFEKGLETVERERCWPVRSAKLMLRTALLALSRHYAPPAVGLHRRAHHWGADDYRPEIG